MRNKLQAYGEKMKKKRFSRLSVNLIIAASLLTGCGTKSSSTDASSLNNNPTPNSVSTGQVKTAENPPEDPPESPAVAFTARVIAGTAANNYLVKLDWHWKPDFTGSYVIIRTDTFQNILTLNFDNTQNQYLDTAAQAGASYTYTFRTVGDSESQSISFTIPLDLEVIGHMNLSQIKVTSKPTKNTVDAYSRVFFGAGATLDVGLTDFELDTQEIYSSETNSLGDIDTNALQAGMGEKGKNGTNILINAQKINHALIIISQGQEGGTGFPGSTGIKGAPGQHGLNEFIPHSGPVTDGGDGNKGGSGGNGATGMDGGDSGIITIALSEPDPDARVFAEAIEGQGGFGGAGGNGGLGGDGGKGGCVPFLSFPPIHHPVCKKDGKRGSPGDVGKAGAPGKPGKKMAVCQQGLGILTSEGCGS
jgi:hypothetical protein